MSHNPVLFVIMSVVVFTGVILLLVMLLSWISKLLSPGGTVKIRINEDQKEVETSPGNNLLASLTDNEIFIPSGCGGGGTCGLCKCKVEGGGDLLPTEAGFIGKAEKKEGMRLACQVKVREDMDISIPPELLDIRKWECTVQSNMNVATFIKELDVKLPPGENLDFKAGGYIQIDIPKYSLSFADFDIEEEYRGDWETYGFFKLKGQNDEPSARAYSMANHPAEGNRVMLNVRIATPPRRMDVPPGISSSYIFNLKAGDKVMISGPYGEFFIKETDREVCFLGGGAGMAPMRSHIFDLFHTKKTNRKVSFWYGARSKREIFYEDEFRAIEEKNDNFSVNIALSEPMPEDNWDGPVGFIHQVALNNYLSTHPDPTEIEYYLCGPPMMIKAVNDMLYNIGVEKEMIAYDEF